MKRYIFLIFTMLLTMFIAISLIRVGTNKSPLDIRKTWSYITSTNANFGNLDKMNDEFVERFNNLTWNYQSIDDASFFQQMGNFFSNVGNFFYNIGIVVGVGLTFIVSIIGYLLAFFVYAFKMLKYLIF